MVRKKSKSKRVTLHQKYKIAKKVREHNRKARKNARKDALKKKKPKDPGIPNSWPFKEELLKQIEATKQAQEAAKAAEKERKKKEKAKLKLQSKKERKQERERVEQSLSPSLSREQLMELELRTAVNDSDLVLVVLDARDPLGCRPLSLENGLLLKGKKKVILVLNKVDLVPTSVAEKWLKYLRNIHPTFAVRSLNPGAGEEEQKIGKKRKKSAKSETTLLQEKLNNLQSKQNIGESQALRDFLKRLGKSAEKPLIAAIVGYPNTGKSSLFNSLHRANVATVARAAKTTSTRLSAQIEGNITLIDTPPLPLHAADPQASLLLFSIAGEHAGEAVSSFVPVLERCEKLDIMTAYKLPNFKSGEEFLSLVAKKKGILRSGGEPDLMGAARFLFSEWGSGRRAFYVKPPAPSADKFEMPEWYTEAAAEEVEEVQQKLFRERAKNAKKFDEAIALRPIVKSNISASTDEYDSLMEPRERQEREDREGSDEEEEEEVSEEESQGEDEEDSEEGEEEEAEEESEEEEEEEEEPVVPAAKRRRSARLAAPEAEKNKKEEEKGRRKEEKTIGKRGTKKEEKKLAKKPSKPVKSKAATKSGKKEESDVYDFKEFF